MALVLIVCDPIVGFFASHFYPEPPYILLDAASFDGLDRFWQMTEAGQKPIVFTGSSMAFYGISPHIFDDSIKALTGKPMLSTNVGMTGQTSEIAHDLIQSIFIPKGVPAIFYATEIRAFAGSTILGSYQTSPVGYTLQFEPGPRKTIGLWLLQHSTFIRYRNNVHDLLVGRRSFTPAQLNFGTIDDRSHVPSWKVQDVNQPMPVPNTFTPLKIEASSQQALAEIADTCQRSNIPCIVVNMPLDQALNKVIPASELRQYQTMLKDSLGKGKIALWDFNTAACISFLGTQAFMDHNHLNETGSQKFTYLLAVLYAHQFMAQPIPAESHADCVQVSS